jgi:hypothetical protein
VQESIPGHLQAAAVAVKHPETHDSCIVVLVAASHDEPRQHALSTTSPLGVGNAPDASGALQKLSEASECAIRAHLAAFPDQYVQPAALAHVPQLPRLPSGKIDRMAISQLPGWQRLLSRRCDRKPDAGVTPPPALTAAQHSELSIMQACMSVLAGSQAAENLEPTTNLLEAGVNSIQVRLPSGEHSRRIQVPCTLACRMQVFVGL